VNRSRAVQAAIWLQWTVAGVSVFVMLLFVATALRRLRYPYELEQLEGYVFLTALRAFHGQPIYPHPSISFIPYMYPPLYYYACAALGRVMGMTIATMRMTSILSTLGCFAAIYSLVLGETPHALVLGETPRASTSAGDISPLRGLQRHLPAIAAAGLYAGCYTVCQEWFDLGRLDSFFVLLVLLALLATRRAHPILAAAMWTLAFQTKQSILPVALVMMCCDWPLDWRSKGRNHERIESPRRRRVLSGLLALGIGVGGSVVWLNHVSRGWYSFIIFSVPGANADIKLRTLAVFWPNEMLRPLGLALLIIVAAVAFTRPSLHSRATLFYLAACSLVPLFWWIDAHGGSTANAPMPIYALVAVLFGIALMKLLLWLPAIPNQMNQRMDKHLASAAVLLLLLAALAQETEGIYNPGDYQPSKEVRAAVGAVIAEARTIPGDVDLVQHPYYAWLAGKPVQADMVSIHDAERPANSAIRRELQTELQDALAQHRYAGLIFDTPESIQDFDKLVGTADWQTYYGVGEEIPGVSQGTRPDWLVEPCATAHCAR
jgi:hypothetical protein